MRNRNIIEFKPIVESLVHGYSTRRFRRVHNSNMENHKQDLLMIIKEYENAIETLTVQIDFYTNEQEHLKKEITNLINENKALSNKILELAECKTSISNTIDNERFEKNLIYNLKKQLSLTLQEKDTVAQLWQNSLRNIDHLEEELKAFSSHNQNFFSKEQMRQLKSNYENQIKNLEDQLAKLHVKIQTILKSSSKNLEDKNIRLEKAFYIQKSTVTQIHSLEMEIKDLQIKIKDIVETRDKLQLLLTDKNKKIHYLKQHMRQSKEKVTEAVQVVEAAFREKDAALLRENIAKEEIVNISKTLSHVLDEASDKIKNDTFIIKQKCNAEIEQAQENLVSLKEQLNNKNIELEKSMCEYKILQTNFEKLQNSIICVDDRYTSKMLFFDKNLDSTFQKLLTSERHAVKIEGEKDQMRLDLQQLTNLFQNSSENYLAANTSLKEELRLVKKKLKKCRRRLVQVTEEATNLRNALHTTECKDKYVEKQLHSYLDQKIKINKNWRKGTRDLVQKYETRLNNIKLTNKCLKRKLKEAVAQQIRNQC